MLKNKKAFTIVELVVVIAIIATLAVVFTPTFNSFIEKAKESNDTVLLKNMNDAIAAYEVNKNAKTATDACIALKQFDLLGKSTPTVQNKKIVFNVDSKTIEIIDANKQDGSWILIEYSVPKEEVTISEIDFKDLK